MDDALEGFDSPQSNINSHSFSSTNAIAIADKNIRPYAFNDSKQTGATCEGTEAVTATATESTKTDQNRGIRRVHHHAVRGEEGEG